MSDPLRVMVVCTDVGWDVHHHGLTSAGVLEACRTSGAAVHVVPVPQEPGDTLPSTSARASLALLPFEGYGDVLVGLGHLAALLEHRCRLVLVDDRVVDALRPTSAGGDAEIGRSLLRAGLRTAAAVVAVGEHALDVVEREGCRRAQLIVRPADVAVAVHELGRDVLGRAS